MATTVQQTVTKTLSASATPSSTSRAASQGGILEGGDPTHYNSKDPIIIFIIQVSDVALLRSLFARLTFPSGWYNHNLLSRPPLASPKAQAASCYC